MPQSEHLVIHPPNWLGDVMMAQPSMRAFAQGMATRRVSIIGQAWLADILPWLDIPGAAYAPDVKDADVCVLFPNNFRSAWQALRIGCKRRIGYRGQWRSMLLSDAISPRISMLTGHHRDYYNDLAIQSGIEIIQAEVHLSSPASAIACGRKLIEDYGLNPEKTLCIAPGAQFGAAKRYPAKRWAEVAQRLSAAGYDILTLGTAAERGIADAVIQGCGERVANSAGSTSLSQCMQLLTASSGLLCNDSGLMHAAAGMGKRVVAVFGATDPERTAPSGEHIHLLYRPAACSPCLQRECHVAGQPCMSNIAPEDVARPFLDAIP